MATQHKVEQETTHLKKNPHATAHQESKMHKVTGVTHVPGYSRHFNSPHAPVMS